MSKEFFLGGVVDWRGVYGSDNPDVVYTVSLRLIKHYSGHLEDSKPLDEWGIQSPESPLMSFHDFENMAGVAIRAYREIIEKEERAL